MSLVKIDAALSAKRKLLAEQIDARQKTFDATDAVSDAIDALQAKDSPSEAETAELEAKLEEFRTNRAAAAKQAETIRATEAAIRDLEAQRAERVEHNLQTAALGTAGRQTTHEDPAVTSASGVRVLPPTVEQLDHDINCFLQNTFVASNARMSLRDVCAGHAGEQYRNDRLHAAVTTTTNPALIPVNYSDRLIELLRPKSTIRSLPGVRNIPLPNGNLTLPRQSVAGVATYDGEMVNATNGDPTTDSIALSAKKLRCQVVQSGEMVRRSSPSSMSMVRDDILQVTSLKEDSTFLRAAGSATIPKGLKAFADVGAAGVIVANQTVNVANVTTDLGLLILKLRNSDVPFLNPVFILSPRSERWLMDARDGNGNFAFPEMARGMLRQYPYRVTTQIPDNITDGGITLTSEVYFVDASELLLGDTPTFELRMSDVATYYDGAALQSAFSQDAVVYQLIVEHDLQIRHNASVAYLSRVIWGKV
jgi:HK97 family phage major capsid protein